MSTNDEVSAAQRTVERELVTRLELVHSLADGLGSLAGPELDEDVSEAGLKEDDSRGDGFSDAAARRRTRSDACGRRSELRVRMRRCG